MNIFRERSVFLTGHTGFKGSWLALWLHTLGAKIHGYSLAPESPNLFEEACVAETLASHTIADVRDAAALRCALQTAKPEIIFHLAAQSLVRRSYREPRQTFETNVLGVVNLLDAVRQLETVRVVQVITSDKCYDNADTTPRRETDPLGGLDPYSSSKACAELVTAAYRNSFFNHVSLATARAGNVIGGGDWAEDRIVPDCIRALEKGESILVRNPNAIRPWQHVLEPLAGYLLLAAHQWTNDHNFSTAFNFGPTVASHISVREIIERIIAVWGNGKWHTTSSFGPGAPPGNAVVCDQKEAATLRLDMTKAATLLHWHPRYTIDQAITETLRWYKARHSPHFNTRDLCLAQIADYQRQAEYFHV
ncbi:MAG: CDP-glucose 4,6-dehydratase [Phycisphaerales bacterium]|nr:CDP-glucose 4,6-dehydratase [Phycisphaerales bacterium]